MRQKKAIYITRTRAILFGRPVPETRKCVEMVWRVELR